MAAKKKLALKGLRVLDFTWVYAGPFCTRQFADLGAEVIKVEPPVTGALERRYAVIIDRNGVKQSSYAVFLNRGKKSLSVDLKTKEGLALVYELAKKSDIVVSNMAPGAMNKLKLGYKQLKKINPGIIYCTISCFGHTGSYAAEPGFDLIAQVASAWSGQTDPPGPAPLAIGDSNAGMHATAAILAAIYHRQKTGEGQSIDISMTDCLFHSHENTPPGYLFSQRTIPAKKHTRWASAYAPYGLYKGKDGLIGIAALSDLLWQKVVSVMGPGYEYLLTDPRTNDLSVRMTYESAAFIHQTLEDWVQMCDSVRQAEDILRKAGVPAMRVRDFEEISSTAPYIKDREMLVWTKQPFAGEFEIYGSPFKMSETPGRVTGYSPFLGENNEEILKKHLGLTKRQIVELYGQKVLYHEDAVERLPEEKKRLGIK